MINQKKFGKSALRFLAGSNVVIAAACWRMNGIWEEKLYTVGDPDLADLIARGYIVIAAGCLLSALIITTSLSLIKGSGKHRA